MTKCDMHIHSIGSSDIIPINFTKSFGIRECYSTPEDIYRLAKERGMDFVTITDHNTIDMSIRLTELFPNDTFTGCEYAVKANNLGYVVDVLCYNLTREQHNDLIKLKLNAYLPEFVNHLKERKILHSLAHPAESMVPKLKITPEILLGWIDLFEVIETRNGDAKRGNDIAEMCVNFRNKYREAGELKKAKTGGSDAHTLDTIARAYTVAPNAKTKGEFLEALACREIEADGEGGSYEAFKAYIHDGVKAYKRYEMGQMHIMIQAEREKWLSSRYLNSIPFGRWSIPKIVGFLKYANHNLKKVVGMALLPVLEPILPQLIAANINAKMEKRTYELEKKCIDHLIKEEYADAYKYFEYVENLRVKYRENTKPEHYYMPKITSRILRYLQNKLGWANTDYEKRDYD